MASGSSGKVGRFTINGPLPGDWSIRKRCCNLPRMKTRIGILTSGGDCPGLNAVLRGAALAADKIGWEMLGFRDGFEGLLPPSDFTALDRLHTTATSHKRVMVVEVMGRHAGWIALHGGIAGGADIILIPEIPFDYDKIATAIKERDARGNLGSLVVVAEGARPKDGQQVKRETKEGEFRLGGIGDIVAREIAVRTGKETRTCVLGHLQRGGAPTTLDRILGTRFGVKAVQLVNEGHFGSMVSYQNYQVRHVPIADAVNRLRLVPPNGEMVQTARDVEISFGD